MSGMTYYYLHRGFHVFAGVGLFVNNVTPKIRKDFDEIFRIEKVTQTYCYSSVSKCSEKSVLPRRVFVAQRHTTYAEVLFSKYINVY